MRSREIIRISIFFFLCISFLVYLGLHIAEQYRRASAGAWENKSPSSKVTVVGTIPPNVDVTMSVMWTAMSEDVDCQESTGFTEAGWLHYPRSHSEDYQPISIHGDQRVWNFFRDQIVPGKCVWKLHSIDIFADRRNSGTALRRLQNGPEKIAETCHPESNCKIQSWRVNDDISKPSFHYCKFSVLKTDGSYSSANPCSFEPVNNDKKGMHYLRDEQSEMQFVLVDLEQES